MTDFEKGVVAGYQQALEDVRSDLLKVPATDRDYYALKVIEERYERRWKGEQ